MAEEQKRIEVDIGAAFAMLQESPELCAAMNEMVGGPALVAAHAEVDRLVALVTKLGDTALAGFKGETDETQALCDINNLVRAELSSRAAG